jgi:hypothetical protein
MNIDSLPDDLIRYIGEFATSIPRLQQTINEPQVQTMVAKIHKLNEKLQQIPAIYELGNIYNEDKIYIVRLGKSEWVGKYNFHYYPSYDDIDLPPTFKVFHYDSSNNKSVYHYRYKINSWTTDFFRDY